MGQNYLFQYYEDNIGKDKCNCYQSEHLKQKNMCKIYL